MRLNRNEAPFKPGDKFQKFEFRRLIGAGGQGFVYEGFDDFLDHVVAIKVIPTSTERASDLRQRAKMEARILFRLRHPNVVQFFSAEVTDNGLVCIVMEMLQGRSLRAVMTELKRLQVDEALLIGIQTAEGLQAAHEQDAIHRDLKPDNVFIEPGNIAKVLDFGIAKITGLGAVTTQQNVIQGTLQYMSPEHLQGKLVTAQSDIFALGCMLYELLSGCAPALMGTMQANQNLIGWNQMSRVPPRLDKVSDAVPFAVGQAIHRMIAKEPANRPPSMAHVAQELKALQTRFARMFNDEPRELWLSSQCAVRAAIIPIESNVNTTVPVAACGELAESDALVPAQPHHAETMPLALMTRSGDPEPQDTLTPSLAAVIPVTITARRKTVAPLVRIPQLVKASLLGIFIGAAVMVATRFSRSAKQGNAYATSNTASESVVRSLPTASASAQGSARLLAAHDTAERRIPAAPIATTATQSALPTKHVVDTMPTKPLGAALAQRSSKAAVGGSGESSAKAGTASAAKPTARKSTKPTSEPPFKLEDMTF